MSRKAMISAPSVGALQVAAAPTPARLAIGDVGEAGGRDALARLNEAMRELKAVAAAPVLRRAIEALNREDFVAGGKWALEGLALDEHNGFGWYLLGIARERAGDFASSVKAYEAALQLLPNHAEVSNDLGRLAYRMGMHEQAEKLFRHYVAHAPDRPEGVNNLASVIRDRGRPDEAIDLLRDAIGLKPDSSMLWNTLGTILIERGDLESAESFFGEAVRLAPKFAKARYNLGQVKQGLGDVAGALVDCDAALKLVGTADDRQMMRLARSNYLLALNRVGEGWDEYEARMSPQFADVTHFNIDKPRWEPGDDIAGKTLLVIGEQGLGDEVLFANVLPDVIEKLGPEGRLRLAVEPRLVPLFQRSFPQAEVTLHTTHVWSTRPLRSAPKTDHATVDLWTPIGSLMREFRRSVDAFPKRDRFLVADPERVAHWKKVLEDAPAGPKVGLLWKSLISKDARHRYFSPFEQWKTVLKTPGVSFVNLQYGDCTAELAEAERELGVTVWQPPGIDLKLDLDDVTALACAMDLVVGFSNATLNLAAAAGAPNWLVSTPAAWTLLGSDHYPWYPQTRVFLPERLGEWEPVMRDIAANLRQFTKR
ncbi:tetratricopeptide repeat protein [uncultured Phenylobacterium sp.]|uniref:tetratricopeptide repeat protein n=1 Tax=uncultured Phenylobacterium sp. TaxID=349273 RepID=UPI0025FBC6B2|nr:tetratricopeptide repeat protein [uncultured Phenylobacterium sp.]